ncbi:MAG: histidine--tRNA ligase [Coriobacteriia bacterium]|nr:histidine--tRNA ligase [Coriobacteriia bacterium]
MEYHAPKGTVDMLSDTAYAWEHLQRVAAEIFAAYGYQPIYTPIFEHTEVFERGIGEATDVVGKEMYTFADKGGRSITLRPEGTASVVRSALEHSLTANGQSAKLYYAGPMFRYERPQKGRMRQFWQIGAEALGMQDPSIDAEVIVMLMAFFEAVGIPRQNMRLLLNSMGEDSCRPKYREKVAGYLRTHADALCGGCVRRADTNPLRAFDCKTPSCKEVMAAAPLLRDELCDECATHYRAVKGHLDGQGILYEEDATLVRGLDYYTRTVFEVQADAGLGSQNAIGGGGRYDGLMEVFGGQPTPGLGFALGFERTLLAMAAAGVEVPGTPAVRVYVARVDASTDPEAFRLVSDLRRARIPAEMDHKGRSLKAQFRQADRLGANLVVVVGPDESAAGEATVRDMSAKTEERVALPRLVAAIAERLRQG